MIAAAWLALALGAPLAAGPAVAVQGQEEGQGGGEEGPPPPEQGPADDPATDGQGSGAEDPPAPDPGPPVPPAEDDAAGADPAPQDAGPPPGPLPPADGATAAQAPAPEPPFDCLAPLGPGGLRERFGEIALRFPDLARAEDLVLQGGAVTPALVLGARSGLGPDARPALALYGWSDDPTWRAALAVAQELLVDAPDQKLLLERATLYLLPALEPEPPEPEGPRPAVAARNFPVGWRPETLVPGAGPYPLAAPAARALAEFLERRGNLSLLVALEDGPCTGPELLDLGPDAYRSELAAASGPDLLPLAPASLCPGTAASFAWAARGVFPARLSTPPLLDPLERPRAVVHARALARAAAEALPRLALTAPGMRVLRPGEVRVDVRIENLGTLPTVSAIGEARRLAGPVELAVAGARVLACASGPSADALSVLRGADGRYALGRIPGRGAAAVCLVLAGESGAEVVLSCRSPRAGEAELALKIP